MMLLPKGIDPRSLVLQPLTRPQLYPLAGRQVPDDGAVGPKALMWCGPRGALVVANPTDTPVGVTLRFGVQVAGPRSAKVTVKGPEGTQIVRGGIDSPRAVEVPVTVGPRDLQVVDVSTDAKRFEIPSDPARALPGHHRGGAQPVVTAATGASATT